MKKYTLKNWKQFCDEALIIPPFEDDEQIEEWFDTHKIYITTNGCTIELEYDADAVNEIEFSLGEIYEAIYGTGEPTTGNIMPKDYEAKITTNAGIMTATPYDDGMAKGIALKLNNEIVCMLDVMTHSTGGGTRLIVYSDYYEDEPTHIIDINKEKEDIKIFSDFDVYGRKYTYDEIKVMSVLSRMNLDEAADLDYEDLMRIVEAVYAHWVDGRDASEDKKYAKYPWLEVERREEGYIQAYAQRVLPKFIELYNEKVRKN